MQKHPLKITDITLNEALKWDVFDVQNNLLLRKGYVVSNQRQLASLVERGLFADAVEYAQSQPDSKPATDSAHEAPSALRLINLTYEQMSQLVAAVPDQPGPCDLPAQTLAITELIQQAIAISPDITLASMLFKQKAEGYAVRHCVDAAIISYLLARSLEKTDAETTTITCAALTMNISMLALQEQLQQRESGPTPDEADFIKRHPQMSLKILQQAGVSDEEWLSCVLHHHENVDGSGYPFGKTADNFPENAKLISLADRYTAFLSPRTYRKAVLPSEALGKILIDRGKGVDPLLAAHFIRTLGIYPPGAFVKLRSGETAVVSHRGKNGGAVVAHALIGAFGAPLPYPHKRETDNERYEIREALHVNVQDIPFNMQQIWGVQASI